MLALLLYLLLQSCDYIIYIDIPASCRQLPDWCHRVAAEVYSITFEYSGSGEIVLLQFPTFILLITFESILITF